MRSILPPLLVAFIACACTAPKVAPGGEKLYMAVELRHEGKLIGKPKLLGETGKPVRVERREPGAATADYRLALMPTPHGMDRYRVDLDVELPRANGHSQLALLHGEELKVELGQHPGELQVTLLLMKVNSPEFRALMGLAPPGAPSSI